MIKTFLLIYVNGIEPAKLDNLEWINKMPKGTPEVELLFL